MVLLSEIKILHSILRGKKEKKPNNNKKTQQINRKNPEPKKPQTKLKKKTLGHKYFGNMICI